MGLILRFVWGSECRSGERGGGRTELFLLISIAVFRCWRTSEVGAWADSRGREMRGGDGGLFRLAGIGGGARIAGVEGAGPTRGVGVI